MKVRSMIRLGAMSGFKSKPEAPVWARWAGHRPAPVAAGFGVVSNGVSWGRFGEYLATEILLNRSLNSKAERLYGASDTEAGYNSREPSAMI